MDFFSTNEGAIDHTLGVTDTDAAGGCIVLAVARCGDPRHVEARQLHLGSERLPDLPSRRLALGIERREGPARLQVQGRNPPAA